MSEFFVNRLTDEPRRITRDVQIGGEHYRQSNLQPWDACEEWMNEAEFIGYLWGSIIKYVARWRFKGGIEDLRKARHFIDKLIEFWEKKHG